MEQGGLIYMMAVECLTALSYEGDNHTETPDQHILCRKNIYASTGGLK